MSRVRPIHFALVVGVLAAGSSTAHAQFAGVTEAEPSTAESSAPDKVDVSSTADTGAATESAKGEEKDTDLDLRLTLSSFAFSESGDEAEPLIDPGQGQETASPYRRLMGDLRLELGAEHIAGSSFHTHLDARFRYVNRNDVQSGFRGGREVDLRNANLRYGNKKSFTIGRQRIDAVDATKIDGLSYRRDSAGPWSVVLFGGTYPTRGSRTLGADYPKGEIVDGVATGPRIIPAILGAGASYARAVVHGSFGAAAIVPWRADGTSETREQPQVLAHSSGYWLASRGLTLYHYATADLTSPEGSAVRNLSASIHSKATDHISLRAGVDHQSHDLLRESVVNQLQDPDSNSMGLVQNGLSATRVASQAARAAVSIDAAKSRFQWTLQAGVRQRPELEIDLADGSQFTFTTSRSAELSLIALDRRSLLDLRLGAQLTLLQGLGKASLATSKGLIGRVDVSREFLQGKGLATVDFAGQQLEDSDPFGPCDSTNALTCYGRSSVVAAQLGAQVMVQSSQRWLILLDGHWGIEKVDSVDAANAPITLPTVQTLSAYLRLQYRFR